MGFSISLRSDNPSAHAVRTLWKQVERFEDKPSMMELGYPPHITLAIYDDQAISRSLMLAVMESVSLDLEAISLNFNAVRHFDGTTIVLYAVPQFNSKLVSLHAAIHRLIDPQHCRPYYRPGMWNAHCTLGTRVRAEDREAALSFSTNFRGSFGVIFDGLDCISFPPLEPVDLRKLPLAGYHATHA